MIHLLISSISTSYYTFPMTQQYPYRNNSKLNDTWWRFPHSTFLAMLPFTTPSHRFYHRLLPLVPHQVTGSRPKRHSSKRWLPEFPDASRSCVALRHVSPSTTPWYTKTSATHAHGSLSGKYVDLFTALAISGSVQIPSKIDS